MLSFFTGPIRIKTAFSLGAVILSEAVFLRLGSAVSFSLSTIRKCNQVTSKRREERASKGRGKEAGCHWKNEEGKIKERWKEKWGAQEVDSAVLEENPQ